MTSTNEHTKDETKHCILAHVIGSGLLCVFGCVAIAYNGWGFTQLCVCLVGWGIALKPLLYLVCFLERGKEKFKICF